MLDDSEVEGEHGVGRTRAGKRVHRELPGAAVTITDDDGAPMLTVDDAGLCAVGVTVEGA